MAEPTPTPRGGPDEGHPDVCDTYVWNAYNKGWYNGWADGREAGRRECPGCISWIIAVLISILLGLGAGYMVF